MRYYIFLIISLLSTSLLAQDLIPYRQNDLWGYSDASGKLIIQPKFDIAEPFGKYDLAIVKKAGKSGIIDKKGKYILPPKYRKVKAISRNLVTYEEGRNTTLMNTAGQVILQGAKWRFTKYKGYPHITCKDMDNQLVGLLDTLGNIILPIDYDMLSISTDTGPNYEFWVLKKEEKEGKIISKWGLVNGNGKFLLPLSDRSFNRMSKELLGNDRWLIGDGKPVTSRFEVDYYLADSKGNILSKDSYRRLKYVENRPSLVHVEKSNLYGFLNKDGSIIIPPIFKNYSFLNDTLLIGCTTDSCHIYHINGEKKKAIPANNVVEQLNEKNPVIIYKKNGKIATYGLVNYTGDVVVPPIYEGVNPLVAEKYFVFRDSIGHGIADFSNNILFYTDYPMHVFVDNQTILVGTSTSHHTRKWGVLNMKNQLVIPTHYTAINKIVVGSQAFFKVEKNTNNNLSNGKTSINKGIKKYGLLSLNGKTILPIKYKTIDSFKNGYAVVEGFGTPNRVGLIDSTGREIINYENHNYAGFYDISDGMIGVTERTENGFRKGYYNAKGDLAIPCIYEEVGQFEKGLAIVKKDGKFGVIDKQQQFIIAANYKNVLRDGDYFYLFLGTGKTGLADVQGKVVLPPIYSNISRLKNGLRALSIENEKIGYIDKNFQPYFTNDAAEYVAKIKAAEAKAREGQIEETPRQ